MVLPQDNYTPVLLKCEASELKLILEAENIILSQCVSLLSFCYYLTSEYKSLLQVQLNQYPIGTPQKHRLVLCGLGLRKIRQTVTRPNTSQVRGMIAKVGYLLEVQPQ
jgi:large subunit ribosomal protein L30